MPPTHPAYDKIRKLKSVITLYQDGEWVFSGRVLNDEKNFYNIKQISVEGELGYLNDSNQRCYVCDGLSPKNGLPVSLSGIMRMWMTGKNSRLGK